MAKKAVTRVQAEAVLKLVQGEHSPVYWGTPTLYSYEHEEMDPGCWSIAWEGGPEDWSYQVYEVPGVFVEARNHWSVGLYPA